MSDPVGYVRPSDLPDASPSELANGKMIVDFVGGSTKRTTAADIVSVGRVPEVLWKWNETDVTQIKVGIDQIGGGAVAITKQTGREGPRLRVAFPTKVSGALVTSLYINDFTKPLYDTDASRYIFCFRLVGLGNYGTTPLGEWYALGPSWAMTKGFNAAHYAVGVGMALPGGAGTGMRIEGGTPTATSASPTWPSFTSPNNIHNDGDERHLLFDFRTEVTLRHKAGQAPRFKTLARLLTPGAFSIPEAFLHSTDHAFANDPGAFGAGWNSVDSNTCGLMFYGTTGSTAGQYFEFDQLCILRHPMDS